ncbi:hypothetical protein J3R82DRAFT_10392 [Butyriboletus roseoflavus]|nr:hypothetical protein J3R82DRAFT_10392 [Butyriboletus roseoflavus]
MHTFLHILATDPAQVLPPGKSLLSVMSGSHITADGDSKLTLHNKVGDLVYKAFWDEAVDTLSNPEPSAQLSRMKLLYGDLHVALSPLLPSKHPVLVTLSSPLSPTSSPLDSALMHLREVLASLRNVAPQFVILKSKPSNDRSMILLFDLLAPSHWPH